MKINKRQVNYIYAIVHNPTGKIYIGNSGDAMRILSHIQTLRSNKHPNQMMQADCNQYGFDYAVYLLEVVDIKHFGREANDREKYWIHYYASNIPSIGYNSPKWYRRIDINTFPKIDISNFDSIRASIEQEVKLTPGKMLKNLRGNNSRKTVADDLGITERTLKAYELDEIMPSDRKKEAIANYYGKSVQHIFYDNM